MMCGAWAMLLWRGQGAVRRHPCWSRARRSAAILVAVAVFAVLGGCKTLNFAVPGHIISSPRCSSCLSSSANLPSRGAPLPFIAGGERSPSRPMTVTPRTAYGLGASEIFLVVGVGAALFGAEALKNFAKETGKNLAELTDVSKAFKEGMAVASMSQEKGGDQLKAEPVSSEVNSELSKGKSVRTALDEVGEKGEFKRKESTFRSIVEKGSRFEPESDRYHLYVALACPWADGTLAALFLKGLDGCIGHSIVHSTWQKTKEDPDDPHCGWVFRNPGDPPLKNSAGYGSFDCDDALIPDTVNGCATVRELYEKSNDSSGKYTTPVLWDKKEGCIVNYESTEILKMFNSSFQDFAQNPDMDLYPAELVDSANAANEWIYHNINNGVYRCGFAKSQEAYEEAVAGLFAHLDKAEEILSKQRYIAGDRFTWMDIRLFNTLIRFDSVYVVYFKTNKGTIEMNYPNLLNYCRDIYQMPAMKRSVNMKHIKVHYFSSHATLNPYGVIPAGRDVDYDAPHGREKL